MWRRWRYDRKDQNTKTVTCLGRLFRGKVTYTETPDGTFYTMSKETREGKKELSESGRYATKREAVHETGLIVQSWEDGEPC